MAPGLERFADSLTGSNVRIHQPGVAGRQSLLELRTELRATATIGAREWLVAFFTACLADK